MNSKDWKCPQCGDNVFGSKDKCRCGCFRSKAKREGDWNCPKCNFSIFASKSTCFKCGTSREVFPSISAKAVIKTGDWICDGCTTHNFASRTACFKCSKAKAYVAPQEAPLAAAGASAASECVICMDKPPAMVISVCGHLSLCDVCAFTQNKCPICRTPYNPDTQLIKVFMT